MDLPYTRKFMPKLTLNRYHIAGLITGTLLVAALILPSIAAGVSASLTTPSSSYVLGSTISLPASVDVGNGEFTKLNSATLTITGPQPVTKALPTTPTSGAQDLGDGVMVTATLVNMQAADGTGYGYPSAGSGYVGYASGAKINYAITWQPPVFLNPPPPTPPPSLPGTNQLFAVPFNDTFDSPILDMASDGTSLYLLSSQNVGSGSSNNRVMVLNPTTGVQVDLFALDSPSHDGLVAVGNYLYSYDNASRELVRTEKASSHGVTRYPINLFGGQQVGALTYDGVNLVAGARNFNGFQKLTLTGSPVGGSFNAPFGGGGFPPPPSINGAEDMTYNGTTLIVAQNNNVFRWDNPPGGGVTSDQVNSPFTSFGGLEMLNGSLYMVSGFSNVYKSTLPGTPGPEPTTVGDYSAQLSVNTATVGVITSSVANFSLAKATSIGLAITAPTDNQAFSTANITVSGTVTDKSVTNVSVGVVLPIATVFSDGAENGETKWSKSGLWHISDLTSPALKNQFPQNLPEPKTGTKVWWYGQESTGNFQTGSANSGDLDIVLYGSASTITVATGTTLSFQTWYDTEPGSFFDKKVVQFVESGGPTEPAAQIVDPGMPLGGQSCGPKCTWVQMVPSPFASFGGPPPGFGGGGGGGSPVVQATPSVGGWALVTFNLDQFNGKTGKIRFKFDSVDGAVNNGKGWFIDDVSISGKGFSGATVPVNTNGTWSTTFSLAEGSNPITASATSAYLSPAQASQTVTASLDTTAPIVTLNTVTTPTGTASQTLSGTVNEANFDLLTVTNNGITVATSKTSPTGGVFSQVINLFPGTNSIVATITDTGGLSGSATASIVLDAAEPTVTVNATRYPVGNISARTGDQVIFDVTAADAVSGMQKVELVPTGGGTPPTFLASTAVPAAVRDQWGTSGNFLLPMEIPSSAASGTLSFTIKAYDNAGNIKTSTVSANIVASLEAFTINLLPDWNFISLPLTPDSTTYAATQTQTQIQRLTSGLSGLDSIWYYDASVSDPAQRWKVYNASGAPSDLTALAPGKGYWVKMTSSSFTFSDPLAPGLASTPAPKKFTYTGTLLQAGANATPPVYPVPAGWAAVGFHSERNKTVSQALRSVSVPTQIWGSLLAYDNYILFQRDTPPQIVLGAFKGKDESSTMEPGRGYWIFMQQAGNIVPTN